MRLLGASVALAVLLLAAAALRRPTAEPPPREVTSPAPPRASGGLPAPPSAPSDGEATDPALLVPSRDDLAASPDGIQVPSQERLHAELAKLLSLDPQQSQRVRDVLDRNAKRMAELLHAERDDAFADRKARAIQAFADELLATLTAEQQIALTASSLWKGMVAPPKSEIR